MASCYGDPPNQHIQNPYRICQKKYIEQLHSAHAHTKFQSIFFKTISSYKQWTSLLNSYTNLFIKNFKETQIPSCHIHKYRNTPSAMTHFKG